MPCSPFTVEELISSRPWSANGEERSLFVGTGLAMQDLCLPITRILESLREKIDRASYGLIIGEDRRGRLPTLLLRRVIADVHHSQKLPAPRTLFYAVKNSSEEDRAARTERSRAIQESIERNLGATIADFHQRVERSCWGGDRTLEESKKRALVVTDTIDSGASLEPILHALDRNGICHDIAAVSKIRQYSLLTLLGHGFRHGFLTYNGPFGKHPAIIFLLKKFAVRSWVRRSPIVSGQDVVSWYYEESLAHTSLQKPGRAIHVECSHDSHHDYFSRSEHRFLKRISAMLTDWYRRSGGDQTCLESEASGDFAQERRRG